MIPGSVVVDTAPTCRGGAEQVSWNAGSRGTGGNSRIGRTDGADRAGGRHRRDGITGTRRSGRCDRVSGCDGFGGRRRISRADRVAGSPGATGATGATGAPGAGRKTISGLVTAAGSLSMGQGVTVMKLNTGTYLLRFPAGTWSSFPAIVVSPFGSTAFSPVAGVDSVVAPADGSASACSSS